MRNAWSNSQFKSVRAPRAAAALALLAGSFVMWGCEADSFMDPSVIGRWEHTPTVVPVLDRLASVEGPGNEGVELSQIRAEDLIPEVEAYRIGAGDLLIIEMQDLLQEGRPEKFEREVDARGYIELPLARTSINFDGMTAEQAQARIIQLLRDNNVLQNAIVTVNITRRGRSTFHMIGGVTNPGLYQIPRPDYRLLEALSQVGRFSEQVQTVYVIRQIPLSDSVTGRGRMDGPGGGAAGTTPSSQPSSTPGMAPSSGPAGKPPVKGGAGMLDLIDELARPAGGAPAGGPPPASGGTGSGTPAAKPKVDLIDEKAGTPAPKPSGPAAFASPELLGQTAWRFENGQWSASGAVGAMQAGGGTAPGSDLVTQRVIEVPLAPLLSGSARYNIVIRPGDVVRVPAPSEGLVYIGGQVVRPGVFNLPAIGKLTLHRAVTSAGGLGSAAIPERVEIIRMIGSDKQAIVRVNLRAIAEGTQPDILLKPDDHVNIGSNFWAVPLAVVRNGFRASYGFGFILDRNFGYDIFGPQRTTGGF